MGRTSNLELMRIMAMFMIVGSHLATHGVYYGLDSSIAYQVWSTGTLINKITTCFWMPGGGIGVGLFFMLTGYFQINKENFSLRKVVLETLFYGWLIGIVYVVLSLCGGMFGAGSEISFKALLKTLLLPVSSGTWWYITAYILVLLFSPTINRIMLKLTKQGAVYLLIISWLLWYAIAYVINAPYSNLCKGIFFYVLGAVYRLYFNTSKNKKWIHILSICFFWFLGTVCYYETAKITSYASNTFTKIISVLCGTVIFSIVVPACTISIFRLFETWKCKVNQFVNKAAATTLGIYLLSDSEITRNTIWHNIIQVDEFWYKKELFPLWAVLITLGIMIVCSVIDMMRVKFIEPVMLNKSDKIVFYIKTKCCK